MYVHVYHMYKCVLYLLSRLCRIGCTITTHIQDDHNIEEFTSKWQKHSTFLIPIDNCKQLRRVYAFYSMENLLLELVLDHI